MGIRAVTVNRVGDLVIREQCLQHLVVCIMLLAFLREAVAVPNLRGVATQDERYYQAAIIRCRDGSNVFPQERLNDDFCDCVDGTDEPGTNACPEAKFSCKNLGHNPVSLFSSRVNDGICDCCDGSDEYDGKINCPNTCWESGKQSREKLRKKFETFKEGSSIRKRDVEAARQLRQQHEFDLVQIKSEEKNLKDIVAKLKVEKEAVEKAEKQEKERREEEEQARREESEKAAVKEGTRQTEELEEVQQAEDLDEVRQAEELEEFQQAEELEEVQQAEELEEVQQAEEKNEVQQSEGAPSQVEISLENTQEVDTISTEYAEIGGLDHLSEAERGRVIASRWTGDDVSDILSKGDLHMSKADQLHAQGENLLKEGMKMMKTGDLSFHESDMEEDGDNYEKSQDSVEDDDYDMSPMEPSDTVTSVGSESLVGEQSSWWSRLSKYILQKIHLDKPAVDTSEADRIKKDYADAYSKLQAVQTKIADLEKRFKQDFGKQGEFYSFYDRCFEYKEKKYVYKVCPYKDALQVEGHSTTRLGHWQGFKEDYREMKFQNGDKCWNGPERSLQVKMRCGTKLELRSVDEPSRCDYVAEFSTPSLCLESKVKALEQQLAAKDPEMSSHDEL